ncbi:hypothetical protein JTE90_013295 [Oedothorax gibbosus]|uniref:Uncharacterized protein n=1 Tax=Oedothorax gibbosus TaxID=931172 RepID=A0AAV6VEW4_9ARAC|nr:hypothetical protein JTE90_013295 [Oedothorax gibbosus]
MSQVPGIAAMNMFYDEDSKNFQKFFRRRINSWRTFCRSRNRLVDQDYQLTKCQDYSELASRNNQQVMNSLREILEEAGCYHVFAAAPLERMIEG